MPSPDHLYPYPPELVWDLTLSELFQFTQFFTTIGQIHTRDDNIPGPDTLANRLAELLESNGHDNPAAVLSEIERLNRLHTDFNSHYGTPNLPLRPPED